MKNLREYILPSIKNDVTRYNKKKYIGNNDLQLEPNYLESSFDKFIELNHISIFDDNTYKYYIHENFNDEYGRYYGLYQKKLYESIVNSYSASDLMEKIYKESPDIHIYNIHYVNSHKITQFSFEVNKKDDLDNIFTNKIIQLLHIYNYYLKSRTIEKDENTGEEHYKITIEPYKPKDITNKIYNELDGILYHITTLDTYINKIKYKELCPKWKGQKHNDEFRDGRIFFIGNRDINKIKQQLTSIRHTSNYLMYNDVIVLKIDLTKYDKKLRFRIDSSAFGYNAYFTEEPIPDYCITPLDYETFNELNKETLKI